MLRAIKNFKKITKKELDNIRKKAYTVLRRDVRQNMKINFKTLCTVGALLCMGDVYAVHNVLSINESSEIQHVTFEEFEEASEKNLPQNMIMEKQYVLIDDSNIDRLIKFADRIILKDCDVITYTDKEPAEKLRSFFSKVFPKSFGINYLSFGCHDVKSILKEACKLPYLRNLELFGEQVEYLPEEIWDYVPKDVKFINFSNTSIRNLPKGISKLQNLEKLYFYTPIENLPKDIESLPNLREVILPTGHNFSVTRFLTKNHTDIHSGITSLCFENGDFDGIESLDLSVKKLDRVPCDIVMLEDLKKLNLSNNNLESIPLFLRNVKNLEILDISRNNIASLPTEIWPFPRTLKYLTIDGFLLKNIPDDRIESITNMRELNEGKINTEYFARLIAAKINSQPSSNKLLLESLGGICIVKLKEPLEERSLKTEPFPEDKPSTSKTCQIQ